MSIYLEILLNCMSDSFLTTLFLTYLMLPRPTPLRWLQRVEYSHFSACGWLVRIKAGSLWGKVEGELVRRVWYRSGVPDIVVASLLPSKSCFPNKVYQCKELPLTATECAKFLMLVQVCFFIYGCFLCFFAKIAVIYRVLLDVM